METLEVQVDERVKQRKRDAKRLLRGGKIPGILYGPKTAPVALELNKKEFTSRVAGLEGSHLVRLKSSATALSDRVALVKEMQYHPVSGDVIHADLYEVDLTAKITVSVPLHFVGKAGGVVRGGILQPIVREIGNRVEFAQIVRAGRRLDDEGKARSLQDPGTFHGVLPGAAHSSEPVVTVGVERIERQRQAAGAGLREPPRDVLGDPEVSDAAAPGNRG